jgi:hypothetical protein
VACEANRKALRIAILTIIESSDQEHIYTWASMPQCGEMLPRHWLFLPTIADEPIEGAMRLPNISQPIHRYHGGRLTFDIRKSLPILLSFFPHKRSHAGPFFGWGLRDKITITPAFAVSGVKEGQSSAMLTSNPGENNQWQFPEDVFLLLAV